LPDTLKKDPAYLSFYTNANINIVIEQTERKQNGASRVRFGFLLKQKMKMFTTNMSYLLRFRLPVYHPTLKIELAGDDVRTIYRALPIKSQIVLTM